MDELIKISTDLLDDIDDALDDEKYIIMKDSKINQRKITEKYKQLHRDYLNIHSELFRSYNHLIYEMNTLNLYSIMDAFERTLQIYEKYIFIYNNLMNYISIEYNL